MWSRTKSTWPMDETLKVTSPRAGGEDGVGAGAGLVGVVPVEVLPVDGLEVPVDGLEVPVDGVEVPVDGLEVPVDGVEVDVGVGDVGADGVGAGAATGAGEVIEDGAGEGAAVLLAIMTGAGADEGPPDEPVRTPEETVSADADEPDGVPLLDDPPPHPTHAATRPHVKPSFHCNTTRFMFAGIGGGDARSCDTGHGCTTLPTTLEHAVPLLASSMRISSEADVHRRSSASLLARRQVESSPSGRTDGLAALPRQGRPAPYP